MAGGAPPPPAAPLGPRYEPPPRAPFAGVEWGLGLLGLMGYLFVIHQGVAPIGEVSVAAALFGTLAARGRVSVPFEVWCFGAFMLLTGVFSTISPFAELSRQAWTDYAKIFTIFWVACNVIRTRQQLRALILVWLLFFGLYPMRGVILNYLGGISHNGRVAWNFTFSNPNDLANLTIVPVTLAAGVIVSERKGPIWLLAVLQTAALCAVVLFTQSRGAAVALFVALVLMLIASRPSPKVLAAFALLVTIAAAAAPSKTWDRLAGLSKVATAEDMQGVDEEGSAEQRYAIWKVARAIVADFPITGVGIGVYPQVHREYVRTRDLPLIARGARDTHSTYLNTLAEDGPIGLGLLLTAWIYALVRSGRDVKWLKTWAPAVALQLQFLRIGFVAFLIAATWGSYERMSFMWLYVALLVAFGQAWRREAGLLPA